MTAETICENYEITIGDEGTGVVLTFDVDDINEVGLTYVKSLEIDPKGFHVELSSSPTSNDSLAILFPLEEGMEDLVGEIKQTYGRMFVAGLGEGEESGTSKIVFAREMLLA